MTGPFPVGRPTEIGGVDVGGETFLEAVDLIGPDEVHFARQDGAIAARAQIVRQRGRLGGKFAGIVIGADARRQLPHHQRKARGAAQRAGTIGAGEGHAPLVQRLHAGAITGESPRKGSAKAAIWSAIRTRKLGFADINLYSLVTRLRFPRMGSVRREGAVFLRMR